MNGLASVQKAVVPPEAQVWQNPEVQWTQQEDSSTLVLHTVAIVLLVGRTVPNRAKNP